MATYNVLTWRGIPSQVKATDTNGDTVRRALPEFFQQEIDRVAMAEGLIDGDEYMELWTWSAPADRDGGAEEVAQAVALEVAQAWRQANAADGG
jgi:hypothetical protein